MLERRGQPIVSARVDSAAAARRGSTTKRDRRRYERLSASLGRRPGDPGGTLLRSGACGLGAGAVAALVTTPADVVKTRFQVAAHLSAATPAVRSGGAVAAAAAIARAEGPRALFAGAGPRLLKVAPACAIMIGTYEYAKALFLGIGKRR